MTRNQNIFEWRVPQFACHVWWSYWYTKDIFLVLRALRDWVCVCLVLGIFYKQRRGSFRYHLCFLISIFLMCTIIIVDCTWTCLKNTSELILCRRHMVFNIWTTLCFPLVPMSSRSTLRNNLVVKRLLRYLYLLTTSSLLLPICHCSPRDKCPPLRKTIIFVSSVLTHKPRVLETRIRLFSWFWNLTGVVDNRIMSSANRKKNSSAVPGKSWTPCLPNWRM